MQKKHAAVISLLKPLDEKKYSPQKDMFFVKNTMSETIRSYLLPEDILALKQSCKTLQVETCSISNFLHTLNHKITTAGYFSHRTHDFATGWSKINLAHAIISLATLVPAWYYTVTRLMRMHDLQNEALNNDCVVFIFWLFYV